MKKRPTRLPTVDFSLPIIDAHLDLANVRSVMCLGNVWTSRRYLMTMERYWPQVEKMLVVVNSFDIPIECWHRPGVQGQVLAEWDKVEPYKANGWLVDWPADRF